MDFKQRPLPCYRHCSYEERSADKSATSRSSTSPVLQIQHLLEHNIIKRAHNEFGWVVSIPIYCQTIREENKEKRLMSCEKMIDEGESFDDVVFTDE